MNRPDKPRNPEADSGEPSTPTAPVSLLYEALDGEPDKPSLDKPSEDHGQGDNGDDDTETNESDGSEPDEGDPDDKGETDSDKIAEGETTISTEAELVEHLDADPEWFRGIKVPIKVDGEPAQATISDLVKSYQIGEAADRRLEEAKVKAKSITDDAAKQSEDISANYAVAARLIERLEAELNKDIEAIDWDNLRDDDTAEYAAKKADVAERHASIEAAKQEAREGFAGTVKQAVDKTTAGLSEIRAAEGKKLFEKLPDWQDDQKRKDGMSALVGYLKKDGFEDKDLANVLDNRLLVHAHQARLYDEAQAKGAKQKKRVDKAPKTMKPGAKAEPQSKPKDSVSILYGS